MAEYMLSPEWISAGGGCWYNDEGTAWTGSVLRAAAIGAILTARDE